MKQLTIEDLGNRDITRANSKPAEQLMSIPLDKIIIREGFNVRQDYGDIKSLADSIEQNGQLLPGRVDVLKNGTFLLTDGHRRFQAMKLIKDKPVFKAFINPRETSEEDRLIQMFATQDNKQLTPIEAAEIIQRLLTFGKSQHQIAIRVGRSDSWVSNMITFARKPDEVKESVRQGKTTMAKVIGKKTRQTITKTDIKLICANELIGMTNVDLIVQILKKYFK